VELSSDLLGRGEVPAAARLLARAFDGDPVIDGHLAGPNKKKSMPSFRAGRMHGVTSRDLRHAFVSIMIDAWRLAGLVSPSRSGG
jgi:hypothetical protein